MVILILFIVGVMIYNIYTVANMSPEECERIKKQNMPLTNSQGQIICAKCGSNQIHSDKRGWKASTGLLGSSQIWITCLKCGHKWKPGKR